MIFFFPKENKPDEATGPFIPYEESFYGLVVKQRLHVYTLCSFTIYLRHRHTQARWLEQTISEIDGLQAQETALYNVGYERTIPLTPVNRIGRRITHGNSTVIVSPVTREVIDDP